MSGWSHRVLQPSLSHFRDRHGRQLRPDAQPWRQLWHRRHRQERHARGRGLIDPSAERVCAPTCAGVKPGRDESPSSKRPEHASLHDCVCTREWRGVARLQAVRVMSLYCAKPVKRSSPAQGPRLGMSEYTSTAALNSSIKSLYQLFVLWLCRPQCV